MSAYNWDREATRGCQSARPGNRTSVSSQTGTWQATTQTQWSVSMGSRTQMLPQKDIRGPRLPNTIQFTDGLFKQHFLFSPVQEYPALTTEASPAWAGASVLGSVHLFHRLTSSLSLEKWCQERSLRSVRRPRCSSLWVSPTNCSLGTDPARAQGSERRSEWVTELCGWVVRKSLQSPSFGSIIYIFGWCGLAYELWSRLVQDQIPDSFYSTCWLCDLRQVT